MTADDHAWDDLDAAQYDAELDRQQDIETLTALFDLMEHFPSNEQRARFLLSSNWLRDHGAQAAYRVSA